MKKKTTENITVKYEMRRENSKPGNREIGEGWGKVKVAGTRERGERKKR